MPIQPCLPRTNFLGTEWSPEGVVIIHQEINGFFMQAVLWQVVDATLKAIRKQYFADLDSFWDARNIYQAQLQALQVRQCRGCHHELLSSVLC